jgi:hypothetical protein
LCYCGFDGKRFRPSSDTYVTQLLHYQAWALITVTAAAAAVVQAGGNPDALDVPSLWGTYQSGRLVRAAAIHGMAREWLHSVKGHTAAAAQQGHC